jgi:predicted adenine nucleotide alpha hydrolase (AANH) superfamily ATPase
MSNNRQPTKFVTMGLTQGLCEQQSNAYVWLSDQREASPARPKILVHTCCGPCSTSVAARLLPEYDVTLFFYNPNITEKEEYERRLAAQREFVGKYALSSEAAQAGGKLTLEVGAYEPEVFKDSAKGLENEPEGGARCTKCFELRLAETAAYAALHGYERFTTTLTVSPHKNAKLIAEIGTRLAMQCRISYLAEDFKKQDGYLKRTRMAKQYGLYRQTHCGCEFSKSPTPSSCAKSKDPQN